ncbi:MAG: hypothetical protein ACK5JD_11150 [Mangrovibacterium sp.]
MDELKQEQWDDFNYRPAGAPAALAAVRRQLDVINWGNAQEFGIIDRATQCFVFYELVNPWEGNPRPVASLPGWPSLTSFLDPLGKADRHFVTNTIEQVRRFLAHQPPASYPHYRLSFDVCAATGTRQVQRALVHLRYLTPDPDFNQGLCLFQLNHLGNNKAYTPPLRAFYHFPNLCPVLFKRGEGHFPCFTKKRRQVFKLLCQGLGLKQIADYTGDAVCTVNNLLAGFRQQMHLSNNTQLVHYVNCFGSI